MKVYVIVKVTERSSYGGMFSPPIVKHEVIGAVDSFEKANKLKKLTADSHVNDYRGNNGNLSEVTVTEVELT